MERVASPSASGGIDSRARGARTAVVGMSRAKRERPSGSNPPFKMARVDSIEPDDMATMSHADERETPERANDALDAPETPASVDPRDRLMDLEKALAELVERFENDDACRDDVNEIAEAVASGFSRVARARDAVDEFSAQAHAILDAVTAEIESCAWSIATECTAIADRVADSERRLQDAKNWIERLHAHTNLASPM